MARDSDEEAPLPGRDVLKLTRFQELVPRPDPKSVVSEVSALREDALADTSVYCPWAEVPKGKHDPLEWRDGYGSLDTTGLVDSLVELLDTPRALKCAFRETREAWAGLRGEINWYDLLLVSALRVAEPGMFEWILRDPERFMRRPSVIPGLNRDTEREKAQADELKKEVLCRTSRQTNDRQEIVLKTLQRLFPAFASRLGSTWALHEANTWEQRIGHDPILGRSYLERILSGCLTEGDIPDQPTLQFIRDTSENGLDKARFRAAYLDTLENLTGPLNKLVEFAALLSLDRALELADLMTEWTATPDNVQLWPDRREFYPAMMRDVYKIIAASDTRFPHTFDDGVGAAREDATGDWLRGVVEEHTSRSWPTVFALLHLIEPGADKPWSVSRDTMKSLRQRFSENLRKAFLLARQSLMPTTVEYPGALSEFVVALHWHEEYDGFRAELTAYVIEQADADETHRLKSEVVYSLGEYDRVAPSNGPKSVSVFTPKREDNEQLYEMSMILPALNRWAALTLPDPVVNLAFEQLRHAYDVGNSHAE
jgi:hypothetical protein